MTTSDNNLACAPLGRLFLKLALPCVVAQLVNALYNIVDRIYIGHLTASGSLALAGLGICYPIIAIISAFAELIGRGGAPRASIAMGADKEEDAQNILSNCFSSMVVVSVALMILLEVFAKKLLFAFGATEASLPYAMAYLRIYALGTVFVHQTLSMNYFIAAQGFAVESMKTTLIGAIVNIVLDPIFIFVFKMGVQGAALASVTAQFCSAVWVILFLVGKKTRLRIQKKYIIPKLKVLLPVLSLGISPFIMVTTESAVQSSFNIQMRAYGGEDCDTLIAGIGIMLTVMQISMLIPQSLGQGAQPIISYNYGAGNYDRIKKTFFILLFSTGIIMIPTTIICALIPSAFGKIFSTDAATIAVVEKYLPLFMAGLGICCILSSCQMSFIALGQAVRSLCIAILRKLVLLIPLMFILPHFMGIGGIIASEPIADVGASITAGIVFWLFSRKLFKKKIV